MTAPVLRSIQVGLPRHYGREDAAGPMDRPWETGFVKEPVAGPVRLGATNLEGDGQADRVHHGGPDKAVPMYAERHYDDWRQSLNQPSLPFGAFGENFTMGGLAEADVCIGDTWRVGDTAIVQVSQPRRPCWKLARRRRIKTLPLQVQESGRTGWYVRVLQEGIVAAGMPVALLERPYPEWTIEQANRVMHTGKDDVAAALRLASIPLLSAGWRTTLTNRAAQREADPARRLIGDNA